MSTKAEIQNELTQSMAVLRETRDLLAKCQGLLKASEKERTETKARLTEVEGKLTRVSQSLETFAAVKFPEHELTRPGYIPNDTRRASELPELFLALRHLYELSYLNNPDIDY